jgi:hypothetical protein
MTQFAASNFRIVGRAGLGHEASTMAHSMAWFRGHLYLGTTVPKASAADDRARVLRYDHETDTWETMYDSPVQPLDARMQTRAVARGGSLTKNAASGGGRMARALPPPTELGREFGLRSMAVFQGPGDPAPCLYVGCMSVWGGLVLRSEDGRHFAPVTTHGLGDDTILSFRGLTPFNGKLFTSPAGTVSETFNDLNLAPSAMIHVSEDPVGGVWVPACEEAFGDPTNGSIFSLGAAHGFLYAGTASVKRGFQLWRTDAEGPAPYRWERVLTDGAARYNHNMSTSAMAEFNGDLYVGSGLPGLGYDKENDVGPAAGELIRVRRDGSWDLIFGEPRFSPDGLKVPLSGRGPGLDDPYNSVIWSMTAHEGQLYLGTHQWEAYDWAMHGKGAPLKGGYQLWASPDGEEWTKLIDGGFGRVTATGLRTLQSTPVGLFVGTTVNTKLLQFMAKVNSGLRDIGETSSGFDVILGD